MRLFAALSAATALALCLPAHAQFSPGPNPVTGTVGAQTLSSGTGTVNSGGSISTTGGTVGVTMTGTSNLVNNGTIQNTGTGRAIDSNSGVANLTVTNNGLISSVSADAFRINTNSSVLLDNYGTIRATAGGEAIDWAAITTGGNVLNNFATGSITAVGADAVRAGNGGIVNNYGTISATPTGTTSLSGSDGIDLRTGKTVTVTNGGLIQGRHGIATDGANVNGILNLTNLAGGVVAAVNGSGVNLDGANTNVIGFVINELGATIRGGVAAGTTDGDGDGIDVDGFVTVYNYGEVLGLGAKGTGNNAEGIAAGGGNIYNYASGLIMGSTLLADAANGDFTKAGNGILIDDSNGGNAVAATTVNNSGVILGRSGFGIKIVGTFADSINNSAGGIIRGAGTEAAVQTGGGADLLINAGSIIGQNGNAIDLGLGDDRLQILGGAASIGGNVSGGSGNDTLELQVLTGNSFSYAGSISEFERVEVQSGVVALSGMNTYTGTTEVAAGGLLILNGQGRLSEDSSLELSGGTLLLTNTAGVDGQTFASLLLSGNSGINLGLSSLTFEALGTIAGGATLAVTNWSDATSPDYAFRFAGDLSTDATFLALVSGTTINGIAAGFYVDSLGFTDVKPVPLPATAWLLLSGLGVLGGALRRRRGNAATA